MKTKDHWLGVAFSVAALLCLVVATTIIHITNEDAWCGQETLTVCVREWVSSAGTVLVGLAAAFIAALQWRAAVRQTHLARVDRRLEIAMRVRKVCLLNYQAVSQLPQRFEMFDTILSNDTPYEIRRANIVQTFAICKKIFDTRQELQDLMFLIVTDPDIEGVLKNVFVLNEHVSNELNVLWSVSDTYVNPKEVNHEALDEFFRMSLRRIMPDLKNFSPDIITFINAFHNEYKNINNIVQVTSEERQRLSETLRL